MPALRSHNSVIYNDALYITGGYGEEHGHSTELFKFDLGLNNLFLVNRRF